MLLPKQRIPIQQVLLYGFWPSFLKIWLYRLRGFKIGEKVSIGFGSVICAEDVEIGDHTRIGIFTIIRGKKVKIGSHVSIGSTTFIDTPYVEIGDECKINEQVFIGGLQMHDSKFVVGKNCQIMQMSFINPAKSVVIGDDSAVGGHCLLFGHNSWLSCFEGYDVVFKPITIGKSVALSWRVFILPGVEIGDGSVIAPESLVNRSIPAKSLAAGYPAKVIGKPPGFPKVVSAEQKASMLKDIVSEMSSFFNGSGLACNEKNEFHEIVKTQNTLLGKRIKTWRMKVSYDVVHEKIIDDKIKDINLLLSLNTIPDVVRMKLKKLNIMWLDIEKKERTLFGNDLGDEVALFIRRYGVRFTRV